MPKTATGPSKAQQMGDKKEKIGSPESRDRARLEAWRLEQLELCREGYQREDGIFISGPLYWAQHYTRTFDDHWKDKGTEPNPRFPSVEEMPYMPYLFHMLMTSKRLFIPKSREMMLTWAVMVYSVWSCQTFPQTSVVIQAQKEDKVADQVPLATARQRLVRSQPMCIPTAANTTCFLPQPDRTSMAGWNSTVHADLSARKLPKVDASTRLLSS